MSNDSLHTIDLDQLATVTGGRFQLPTQPAFKSADGKVRVFELPGGNLKIMNLSRSANPRSVVVRPVAGL